MHCGSEGECNNMEIQESVRLLINDFAGPEDFASLVQSWWSGNSNDVIAICRSGRVLCRAEGEVALGVSKARMSRNYSISSEKSATFLDNLQMLGLFEIESQSRPRVLSHFSRHILTRVDGVMFSVTIVGGIACDERFHVLEDLFHSTVPDMRKFYKTQL